MGRLISLAEFLGVLDRGLMFLDIGNQAVIALLLSLELLLVSLRIIADHILRVIGDLAVFCLLFLSSLILVFVFVILLDRFRVLLLPFHRLLLGRDCL